MPNSPIVVKLSEIAPPQFAQGYEDAKGELSALIRRALAKAEAARKTPNHSTRASIIADTVAEWLTEP